MSFFWRQAGFLQPQMLRGLWQQPLLKAHWQPLLVSALFKRLSGLNS